jgi:hypothetical protein
MNPAQTPIACGWSAAGKAEVLRQISIEDANSPYSVSRDVISQIFTHRRKPHFRSSFQLVRAVVCGDGSGRVGLAEILGPAKAEWE